MDTLRADHLPSYGYGLPTAAALEDLAASGTVLVNAFSASSSTVPSHASIFTGRYPSYHSTGGFNGRYRLLEDETTLADRRFFFWRHLQDAHGHSVALDQVRVPLLLSGPDVPAGRTVREPDSNVAVFAIVLDALGAARGTGPGLSRIGDRNR